jgi:hypothetical protein
MEFSADEIRWKWIADGDQAEKDAKSATDTLIARHVCFLSINGQDPSDEFMKRFQDFPRRIAKVSAANQTKGPVGRVGRRQERPKSPGIFLAPTRFDGKTMER